MRNPGLGAGEALAMVPGWDPEEARIEKLTGGLTNRVYHVRSNGRECALRLDTDAGGRIGPDRSCEATIMETAAEAGIAPRILYSNPEAGILMTEFLHGRVWQESDLESNENLEALAGLLRRVHDLPVCGSAMDLEKFAEKYEEHLNERDDPDGFVLHCVNIVRERATQEDLACCHNDIVATNVIDAGGLHLVDWEFACDNDPFFDLASVIGFHDLDEKRQQVLLCAYAGGVRPELGDRLAGQVRVFDAIQWLWLAAHQRMAPRKEQARRLEVLRRRIL